VKALSVSKPSYLITHQTLLFSYGRQILTDFDNFLSGQKGCYLPLSYVTDVTDAGNVSIWIPERNVASICDIVWIVVCESFRQLFPVQAMRWSSDVSNGGLIPDFSINI